MKLKFHKARRSALNDLWYLLKTTRNKEGKAVYRPRRMKNIYFGITTFAGYCWSEKLKKWLSDEEYLALPKGAAGDVGSHYGNRTTQRCRSIKAFQRRLKQWSTYLPKGVEFILCSRYDELNVTGRTG